VIVWQFFATKVNCDKMDLDRPRLPVNSYCYRLSRVSRAIAQIYCCYMQTRRWNKQFSLNVLWIMLIVWHVHIMT